MGNEFYVSAKLLVFQRQNSRPKICSDQTAISIGAGTDLSDSKTQALKRATPGISKCHSKGPNSKHFGVCPSEGLCGKYTILP